jgi:hypothetical protein
MVDLTQAPVSPPSTKVAEAVPLGKPLATTVVPPQSPVLRLDFEGCISEATPAARSFLGFQGDAHMPECFFSLVHGNNLYRTMRDVANMVCYGKARAQWMIRMRTGDRRYRWVSVTALNRLNGEEGAILIWLRPA